MLIALRRLEDRGEIRGGRFVSGFLGEQFALPVAVESLRAQRNAPASGETISVSAADPLNLVGILVPGERVAANSGKLVAFRDGVAVEAEERSSVLLMAAAHEPWRCTTSTLLHRLAAPAGFSSFCENLRCGRRHN